ncbi:helicase associated domain-containing protein [Streptomyces sp. NPDC014793]|uniref:helicase associated domain-containing protein n=1 Tax=Streptomyces sp. NPDC014793 TaxID=3364914 RepID=UPI0036FE40E8
MDASAARREGAAPNVPVGPSSPIRRQEGVIDGRVLHLGKKDAKTAATRAEQLTAIDKDRNCPWPLDWQRHHRVLADLAADEPDGRLPDIAPGVHLDGDDLGRWLRSSASRPPGRSRRPSSRKALKAGREAARGAVPGPRPRGRGRTKRPSKAQQAFQRGLAALAQWVEREGAGRPVPRSAIVQIAVNGQSEPVPVRLGVWISNTRARRDKLNAEQLAALRKLGMQCA